MALIEEADRRSKAMTVEAVRKLKATDVRQEVPIRDGLYLVIQPSGVKSWVYRGRVRGETKKITLGRFPEVDLVRAKERANDARKDAHAGVIYRPPIPAPVTEAAPEAPEGRSVSEVWKQYRTLRLEVDCRPTTIAEHARIFAAHIEPALGSRDIGTITKADLLPITDAALTRGLEARNKTVAVMTGFFGWAHEKRDLIAKSPVLGIEQINASKRKDRKPKRALTDAEIVEFWRSCGAIDADKLSSVPFGKMFQLLLLTGARRNEVAGLSRTEIEGNVWTLPAVRAKNGIELKIHLTRTALDVLKTIPRIKDCPYVFGPSGENCGFGFSKAKKRLDAELTKIKAPWKLHDLRRTFRTGLGRLGISEEIAERCINHPPGGLVRTYDQHKYEAEMAAAWRKWEKHVLTLSR
ncbi:tyrosine-type recombinase/integrase [Bradyrhizobium sp. LLZ17]|uniref:Tyrosine-type recombinase/integrase n=1 Tax=Bradyrhizobium sp. LLZ17 TaxID=3239388 RepID=A0AB39XEN0_9BRAD